MLNRFALLTACFFLSWQILRVPQANFNVSDTLFAALFILLLLSGALRGDVFGRLTLFWIGGIALMLGALLVSSLVNDAADRWIPVAIQYLFALMIIPMVLRSFDRPSLQSAAMAFVAGVAISQLLGLLAMQFLSYDQLEPYFGPAILSGNGRLGAMTGEPNWNGAVCVFALIMLIHCRIENWLSGRMAVVGGALILSGLVASASFSAFLAGVVSVSLFLILARFSIFVRFILPLAFLVTAYVGMGGPLPKPFEERVMPALVTGDIEKAGTFTGRSHLIVEAWERANDHILIGLGADRYREVTAEGMPVHNLPLLILNEGGIVATFGLVAIFLSMALTGLLCLGSYRPDGAACLAMTVAFLIYTMSIPHMYARIWIGAPLIIFALAIVRYEWPRLYSDRSGSGPVRGAVRATG